jgi:hypothetical protein
MFFLCPSTSRRANTIGGHSTLNIMLAISNIRYWVFNPMSDERSLIPDIRPCHDIDIQAYSDIGHAQS